MRGTGAPLTPLTTNPVYGNGGEVPTAARGSGIQTVDGFLTRTPFQSDVDVQAAYDIELGGSRRLTLLADVGDPRGAADSDAEADQAWREVRVLRF